MQTTEKEVDFYEDKSGIPHTAHICSDESVQFWCTRLYLERAKQALIDAGEEYKLSRAEVAAAKFDDNIPAIHTFKFCIANGR